MKKKALMGAAAGFVLGFALIHSGCDDRTFQYGTVFVFNLLGALFLAVVGLLIGWAFGD
jgi:hypothetical protein